jgi:hypothetical protein
MKIEEMEMNDLISYRETVASSLLENKDKFPIYDRIDARVKLLDKQSAMAEECELNYNEFSED